MAYLKFAIYALGSGSFGYVLFNYWFDKQEKDETEELFLIRSPDATKYEEKLLRVLEQSTRVDPLSMNAKNRATTHDKNSTQRSNEK